MEWSNGEVNKVKASTGRKRPREAPTGGQEVPAGKGVEDKKGCGEPFSWWTQLMLGISERQSRVINRSDSSNC